VTMDVASLAERALRQQIERRLLPPRDEPTETDAEKPQPEQASEDEAPAQRERSRDVLLRGLLDRRERQARETSEPAEEQGEAEEEGREEEEAEPPPA
jgi:AsmA protein